MFMKRAMYSWRNWKMVAAQFLVPLIFTAFALVVAKTFPGPRDSSLLRLTLEPYGQTIVPFSISSTSGLSQRLAEQYVELLDTQCQSPLEVLGEDSWSTHGAGDACRVCRSHRLLLPGPLVWVAQAPAAVYLTYPLVSSPAWEGPTVGRTPPHPSRAVFSITLCLWPSLGLGWATGAGAAWGLFQLAPISSHVMGPARKAVVFGR